MNKIALITVLVSMLLFASTPAWGKKTREDREAMRKEMTDFKIQYLSQEMELNADQQARFAELYRKMSQERRKIFQETYELDKRVRNNKNATEADYQAASRAITQAKERDAELEKAYDSQFATFLSSKQIFKMKSGEQKFRDKMRKMRKHKK